MKKIILQSILAMFVMVAGVSVGFAYVTYYSLFVIDGEDNPGKIYQLKVLPDGQILDSYTQYTVGWNGFISGELAVTNNYNFLFISTGEAIYRYRVQSNGTLVALGSTLTPQGSPGFTITPNNQLLITVPAYGFGIGTVFSISSIGDLVNGAPGLLIASPKVDPLGRGLLAISSFSTFSAYTINYNSKTLSLTTTYPLEVDSPFYFAFTPNGNLGFFYSPVWDGLGVLSFDSLFNVSTTQVLNIPGSSIGDLAVSKDGRYLWASESYIELFAIDTLGNVTDTGKEYYVSNDTGETLSGFQKITPDGSLAIVDYLDLNSGGECFATALINGDGSLTWTGYSFAFDSAHPTEGTVVDYAIIPVYATGIPEEFWKDSPPEMIIHDSQKILMNP